MDARHFDALTRTLTDGGTRRALLSLLAALPIPGGLVALFDLDATEAKGRRKRRKKRHKHGKGNGRRRKTRRCKAPSRAKTCANRCGIIKNPCKKRVNCGSCVCEPTCPVCQACNPSTGACEPDPQQIGDDCGAPGQVCQADGQCACDETSCAPCERCQGDGSCSLPCDGEGCCAEGNCVAGFATGACGRDGADCVACTGPGRTCGGGGTPGVCGCTPSPCPAGANCGTLADGCGGRVRCGPDACAQPADPCLETVCTENVCTTGPGHDGAACSDACTTGATCQAGTCTGATICTTPPECRTAAGATCHGGICDYPPTASGTACGSVACGRCDGNGACVGCAATADCTCLVISDVLSYCVDFNDAGCFCVSECASCPDTHFCGPAGGSPDCDPGHDCCPLCYA